MSMKGLEAMQLWESKGLTGKASCPRHRLQAAPTGSSGEASPTAHQLGAAVGGCRLKNLLEHFVGYLVGLNRIRISLNLTLQLGNMLIAQLSAFCGCFLHLIHLLRFFGELHTVRSSWDPLGRRRFAVGSLNLSRIRHFLVLLQLSQVGIDFLNCHFPILVCFGYCAGSHFKMLMGPPVPLALT